MTGISAQGSVIIHSAPRALLPHVEWAIGRLLGGPTGMTWTRQSLSNSDYRTEYRWAADESFAAVLASELMGWGSLRFEITQEQSSTLEAWRWAYTPDLGLFQGQMDSMGSVLVSEHRMRAILAENGSNLSQLKREVRTALGEPWDDELEPFRHAGDGARVVWLHRAG